jgi:hypothetical protein
MLRIMEALELKIYNDLLLELYNKGKGSDPFLTKSGFHETVLIELLRDDLCIYANRVGIGSSHLVFGISNSGKRLIENLPTDFTQNPYGWYLDQKLERENREKMMKQKAEAKLDCDLKMAKRAYKFYWVTFFMAIAGLIVSVISLLIKRK